MHIGLVAASATASLFFHNNKQKELSHYEQESKRSHERGRAVACLSTE
jgi:hypothetical protein